MNATKCKIMFLKGKTNLISLILKEMEVVGYMIAQWIDLVPNL